MNALIAALTLMIPAEHANAIAKFPPLLQDLIKAELAAGNSIVEINHSFPAPPVGASVMLAKPLLSRPRASDTLITFRARNNSSYSAEITDSERLFFILEAPLPPPPVPDMDAIRATMEARQRAVDADMGDR